LKERGEARKRKRPLSKKKGRLPHKRKGAIYEKNGPTFTKR